MTDKEESEHYTENAKIRAFRAAMTDENCKRAVTAHIEALVVEYFGEQHLRAVPAFERLFERKYLEKLRSESDEHISK